MTSQARRLGRFFVGVFAGFHAMVLVVHNTPAKGLGRGLHSWFNRNLHMSEYLRTVGATQSWWLFAPNPNRRNIHTRVLVEDRSDDVWDLRHDIFGEREHPYLFYSRMGRINRRIVEQRGYQRHYAAWVCREWEHQHDGVPAARVRLVELRTPIPPPDHPRAQGGFDPGALPVEQIERASFACAELPHGQLSPQLRERYGLPEDADVEFRDITIYTWFERARIRGETRR